MIQNKNKATVLRPDKPNDLNRVTKIIWGDLCLRFNNNYIRIACPSWETCVHEDCCYSEIALWTYSSVRWRLQCVFSPWYSLTIAELALKNIHSQTVCFVDIGRIVDHHILFKLSFHNTHTLFGEHAIELYSLPNKSGKITNNIYTHYIHSVLVQDFVLGRACCVHQYHYESR
jgi:hypothetical protein